MSTIASLITSLTIVYLIVYSNADQRKHQSPASLAFVWGIHREPVNSPHKWPVTRKMFPFDDVIMIGRWHMTWQSAVLPHYCDVTMGIRMSAITHKSTVCLGGYKPHFCPVVFPHKEPATRKPFHVMTSLRVTTEPAPWRLSVFSDIDVFRSHADSEKHQYWNKLYI